MVQTCAVTGTGGYIGSHCLEQLRRQGHRVRKLRRNASGEDIRFRLGEPLDPLTLAGVDSLIHCAYDYGARTWGEEQWLNVAGSKLLFDAAKSAGVRNVVFISSVSAFEGCASFYGRGKLAVERRVLELGGIALRPGLVYGEPGQGIFGALCRLTRLPIVPVFDGGRQPLVLAHVDDLAMAIVRSLAWDAGTVRRPVTLAHPGSFMLVDILRTIAVKQGRRLRTVSIPGALGLTLLRAAESLGLRPRFRSDSLVSLLHPNPNLDFTLADKLGLAFRSFADVDARVLD
ncbi:MAG: NAD-dependent epimerase/dehydratase family protein [Pseudomonadota bacterium]